MDHPLMLQAPPSVSLRVSLVADVQDTLLMAMTDLKRLEGLLDHATGNLLARFSNAHHALGNLAASHDTDELLSVRHSLHQAVTELQFHDMATQLIVHTGKLLQGCAWKLATEADEAMEAMEAEKGGLPMPVNPTADRPSPVTQSEMDAGSIELF